MKSVAIITARGGSKRIPGKNIKEFCGRPVISYSIHAAIESGVFDEVMVSTDSTEIAEIAKRYGAAVPFMRSQVAASDTATTADALRDVLDKYKGSGREFETFCCIYPAAPFVTAERLAGVMNMLYQQEDVGSIIPVVAFSYPPQRSFMITDGVLKYRYPEYECSRSQDLEKIYHDCGQFYACRISAFLSCNSMVTQRTIPIVLSEFESQDIDSEEDWKLAELKYLMLNGIAN